MLRPRLNEPTTIGEQCTCAGCSDRQILDRVAREGSGGIDKARVRRDGHVGRGARAIENDVAASENDCIGCGSQSSRERERARNDSRTGTVDDRQTGAQR